MRRFLWVAVVAAFLACAAAHCSQRRADAAACVLDVTCFGELRGDVMPPLACAAPARARIRLTLRGTSTSHTTCASFFPAVFSVRTTGTRWEHLPERLLRCMPRLAFLHLPNNVISALPPTALANLTELRSLDLSANYISEIPVDALADTPNLQRLLLAHNNISAVREGTFVAQAALDFLDLSYNSLMRLESGSFGGLDSIKILKLNNNNIFLLNGALKRLFSLEHLYLRGNKLHHVDIREIPIYSLQTLDITNNTLSSIQPEVFSRRSLSISRMSSRLRIAYPGTDGELRAKILLARNKIATLENASFADNSNGAKSRPTRNNDVEFTNSTPTMTPVPTEIDLSFNMIDTIEFDAFQGISKLIYLDLSSNKLVNFHINTTNLDHLARLYLQNNYLNTIDSKTFYNLYKMAVIDVSGNQIGSLPTNSWWAPRDLTSLKLANNALERLDGDSLGRLESLDDLDVSGNSLVTVFISNRQISGLQRLALQSNNISDLAAVRLHYLLELTSLDLSRNHISTVTYSALAHLPALKWLDMSFNTIAAVESGAFAALSRLTTLDLSENNLTTLHYGSFSGLVKLQKLDLSRNRLAHLESRVLFDLQSLSQLNLEENTLHTMDVDVWKGRRVAIVVNVGRNRLSCSWVAGTLNDAREGWSGAWLTARRESGATGDSSVGGISCLPAASSTADAVSAALTIPRGPHLVEAMATDERLLYTNQKILNAILTQTSELKKALKMLVYTRPNSRRGKSP